MFHLFNKVYLNFDFALEGTNRMIISKGLSEYAFEDNSDGPETIASSYEEIIQKYFDNDEKSLWAFLTAVVPQQQFVIYADEDNFTKILVTYLNAVFPYISIDQLYTLYRLTLLKFKLIHSQIAHLWPVAKEGYHNLTIMSNDEFNKFTKGMLGKIDPFSINVKKTISFEYLLASYLANEPTVLDVEFEERARKMIWKNIGWEINEFKRNLLNGLFNLNQLFPELGDIDFNTETFETILEKKPELKFLQDRNCGPHDIDYLKQNYDIGEIFKFYYKLQNHTHGDAEAIDGFLRAHETYAGTLNSVIDPQTTLNAHDENIEKLVQMDIDTKFGTQLFARAEYRDKMNPFIISYFYHLKRTSPSALKSFAA